MKWRFYPSLQPQYILNTQYLGQILKITAFYSKSFFVCELLSKAHAKWSLKNSIMKNVNFIKIIVAHTF